MMKLWITILSLLTIMSVSGKEVVSKIETSLSLDHYMGFYEDVDPQSKASLTVSKQLNKKTRLEILQSFTKYYVINPGDNEFQLADTSVYVHRSLSKLFKFRLGMTLPVSETSQDNGKVSTLSARLSVGESFLKKKLFLSYRPYANYSVNKYKADIYGNPMTKSSIGNILIASYSPLKKLSLVAVAAAGVSFKERSQYQASDETSDSGFYSFDLFASAQINKNLGVRLGYSQGDAQLREGVREIYFYDEYNSLYYFGTDITF